MPDREKLMSLIWHKQDCGLTHNANGQDFVTYNAELADHLIAKGVTVRERGRWETTEVTEEWETVERYSHFHRECKYSYCDNGLGGHYFCPNCGADMRGEEDA